MLKPRFCYRISAAAGLAHDKKGNNVSCFTQVNYEGGNPVSKEVYDSFHEEIIIGLSEDMKIAKEHFECISQEEFDENHSAS